MTIGERIKSLREQRGLTQEELAKRCGYKSRSSINKIELSRKLPADKIEIVAKALGTTPSYLMGWYDNPDDRAITKEELVDLGKPWIEIAKEVEKLYYSDRALKIAQAFDGADEQTREMVERMLAYSELMKKEVDNGEKI